MKPCWRDCGLTDVGAKNADMALDTMMEACCLAGSSSVAMVVLKEALFRIWTLPCRLPGYQRKYMRDNS